MPQHRALIAAALLFAGVAAGDDGGPPPAEPGPDAIALVRDGRFADAYQRLVEAEQGGDPAAVAALARALLARAIASEDSFERWAGMRAARTLHDPSFVAPARTQLRSGSRYEEALALEILAQSDPIGSRDEFIAALDSPFRTVRVRALRALAPRADAALVPRLLVLAGEDRDPDLRVLAIRTLRAWQATGAVPTLRHAVDDPAPSVQQEAVLALVALGDRSAVGIVRRRLKTARSDERVVALRLAALIPRRELLPAVAPMLGDPDPEVRAAAARAVLLVTDAEAPP
ncbi:MAG: HEAT repeat domain-containing protein [Deltaproteobacteria bacterium]|nr:HEAT repeat domain-containing protein [Deltaproteobacteria bacterium]